MTDNTATPDYLANVKAAAPAATTDAPTRTAIAEACTLGAVYAALVAASGEAAANDALGIACDCDGLYSGRLGWAYYRQYESPAALVAAADYAIKSVANYVQEQQAIAAAIAALAIAQKVNTAILTHCADDAYLQTEAHAAVNWSQSGVRAKAKRTRRNGHK